MYVCLIALRPLKLTVLIMLSLERRVTNVMMMVVVVMDNTAIMTSNMHDNRSIVDRVGYKERMDKSLNTSGKG